MDLFGPMTARAIHVNACSMYVTAKLTIAHGRMQQCLGFGAERYAAGNAGEIERLDAESIACEHEPPPRIPQCNREAVKLTQEVEAAVLVEMDEYCRRARIVGMISRHDLPGRCRTS